MQKRGDYIGSWSPSPPSSVALTELLRRSVARFRLALVQVTRSTVLACNADSSTRSCSGSGQRLFGAADDRLSLTLVDIAATSTGVIMATYRP